MDGLKELFGDGALTAAEFEAKVAEKGYNLADLSGGRYVDKSKFDRLKSDFDRYKADNDVTKYADYDKIVQERDALRAEKQERELVEKVSAAKVSAAFQKFVVSEVKQKVSETMTFDDALAEYVKSNPQYIEGKQAGQPFRIPSQVAGDEGLPCPAGSR